MVTNISAVQELWVQSLGSGRSPGEGSSYPSTPVILPGKFYGQREKPGGLLPWGSQKVRHDWSDLACTHSPSLSLYSIYFVSVSLQEFRSHKLYSICRNPTQSPPFSYNSNQSQCTTTFLKVILDHLVQVPHSPEVSLCKWLTSFQMFLVCEVSLVSTHKPLTEGVWSLHRAATGVEELVLELERECLGAD